MVDRKMLVDTFKVLPGSWRHKHLATHTSPLILTVTSGSSSIAWITSRLGTGTMTSTITKFRKVLLDNL